MNDLLLNFIATQAGSSGNPAIAAMLARMQAVARGDVRPTDLMAQLGAGNPAVEAMMKQMAEIREVNTEEPVVIDVEPSEAECQPESENELRGRMEALIEELKTQLESVQAEQRVLSERNDFLAAALGACCLCWGQDSRCRSCRGRGEPGFAIPDKDLFDQYVLPAVQTFRAQQARFRKSSPASQSQHFSDEARLHQTTTS